MFGSTSKRSLKPMPQGFPGVASSMNLPNRGGRLAGNLRCGQVIAGQGHNLPVYTVLRPWLVHLVCLLAATTAWPFFEHHHMRRRDTRSHHPTTMHPALSPSLCAILRAIARCPILGHGLHSSSLRATPTVCRSLCWHNELISLSEPLKACVVDHCALQKVDE